MVIVDESRELIILEPTPEYLKAKYRVLKDLMSSGSTDEVRLPSVEEFVEENMKVFPEYESSISEREKIKKILDDSGDCCGPVSNWKQLLQLSYYIQSRSEISEIIEFLERENFDFKVKQPNKVFKWIDAAESVQNEFRKSEDPFLCEFKEEFEENFLDGLNFEESHGILELNRNKGEDRDDEEVIFIEPLAPEISNKYVPFYESFSFYDELPEKPPRLYTPSDYFSTEKEHERLEKRWQKAVHRRIVETRDEEVQTLISLTKNSIKVAAITFESIQLPSMTVADDDFREVVQAVRAILDSTTLNQERRRCTEKIESLKEGDAALSIPIAFKLLLQEDKQVSHVGWNILEHVIRYKWADLPGDLRVTIRDGVLEHLSNGRYSLTSADLPVKTAISRSMVAMMEQEWPQNWPELFAQFKNIVLNDTLFPQAQMVFIVLKRLIENVITYATISNPMRRKELSTSVNTIMPELLSMTISRIRICIAQGVNDNSILVAKAGIDLLSESVDWVVGRVLEEVVDGIIEVLCAYLRTEAYGIYEDAALCLFKIASRKRAKNDETPIVVSMFKDAPMNAILTAARLAADVSSSSEGHYKYLKALCDLLTALGVHLSEIWTYIKNPPPNFTNYLREIAYYFVHPSMRIRSEVALVLVTFASHEQISMTEEFIQCVKLLIPSIPKNIEKTGSLTDMTSMTSHYARMDYEDDVEFLRDFMQLRDRVCRFTKESAEAHSAQFISYINEWIARIISNPTSVSDTEFECIKRFLTAIVPALYRPTDGKIPKEVDEAFVYNFNVLMNCLQSVGSPSTVNLMLSIPSSFLQLFEYHSELLPPFFEQLRRILMIDVASPDVITLKRHAISLMLKVSSSMPKVIEPYAQFVFDIVTNTAAHVTVIQRATLIQVLGALSNLVPPENKILFLQSAISGNVEFFASDRLVQAINSVANFMGFIGLTSSPEPDDNTNSQYFTNRLDLKAHLCAIDGILQQVNVPDNQSNPLFQLLGPLLPTFFQLAHCINSLTSSSSIALINNGFDRSVIDIGSHERHLIYCAVMDAESQETEESGSGVSSTERFRRYIADITDMMQSIIGLFGSQLYFDFYRIPTIQNLLGSLVNDLDFIIDFRMRFWIRRTFKALIVSCPKGLEDSIIPFTSGFTNHMRARIKARWDSIAVVDYDAEPTKEEIFLEHMTYVLSREYAAFLKTTFLGEFNVSKDDNRKSPQEVITPSGSYLLKDRNILAAVIATLCNLLNCNDTQTALKIIPVTRIVFGTTFEYFDDEMSHYVLIKAIQSLQVHGADEVALGPILSLVYQIYTNLRPQHATLIEILRQVPETTPEGIAAFDERIVTMSSQTDKIVEKHRREIMKKILRPVIARNVGEQHKRPSHLRVLQPLVRQPKCNGDSSSDISLENSIFA